jgi:thymidylate synthase (FAD)
MSVRLIWVTPDAEKVISYCARVSNPANQENYATAGKLLKYCAKNGHWSVFEQACMCVEIETTRAISAQILRHRTMFFQEMSQRYQTVDESALEIPHLRRQDTKNRQNSIDDIANVNSAFEDKIKAHFENSVELYKELLDQGVAKECARFVLPLSTKTRMYMTGSIRSFIHYCQVRCDPATQKEHRDVAVQVRDILLKQIPCLEEILG